MNQISAAFREAVECQRAARFGDAEEIYKSILVHAPHHLGCLLYLGMLYQQTGRHAEAIDTIGRGIALQPRDAALHTVLGNALSELGRYDEAETAFLAAAKINPAMPEHHYNLGTALEHAGRHQDSVDAYRRAIALKPDFVEAHDGLGRCLEDVGEIDDAAAHYREAIWLRPDHVDARLALRRAVNLKGAKLVRPSTVGAGTAADSTTKSIAIANRAAKLHVKFSLDDNERMQHIVLRKINEGCLYGQEVFMFMSRVLRPGDFVLDIGANFGYYAVLAGKLVGSSGRTIAIEANPRHAAAIRHHLEINGIEADIRIVAISDYSGNAQFVDFGPRCGHGTLCDHVDDVENRSGFGEKASQPFDVHVTTLDAELATIGCGCPKLIKMDVAGAELRAIKGSPKAFSDPTLEFVVCYCRDTEKQMILREQMKAYGFDTHIFSQDIEIPQPVPSSVVIIGNAVTDMLFSRPGMIEKYYPFVMPH